MPAARFYLALAVSGVATVLLGPILPVLTAHWQLTDVQGGLLFTAQFLSSVLGSALSSYFPRRSVVLGFGSITAAMVVLALGHYRAALFAFALVGLGVGSSISAINLIFGNEYPDRRGSLLTHVNLCWGIGAVLAPQMVAIAERENALRGFLLLMALSAFTAFAVFTPLLRAGRLEIHAGAETEQMATPRLNVWVFGLFSLIMLLYIGTETTIAGWIATYSHRFSGLSVARASSFVSVFWLSLVVGRAIVAALLKYIPEQRILLAGIAAGLAGIATLLFPLGFGMEFVAVVVAGVGCAPIYPLVVSKMFARIGRNRHAGWSFAICGSGGAIVPWITGLISQCSGLRVAFLAPLAALGGILIGVLVEGSLGAPGSDFVQN